MTSSYGSVPIGHCVSLDVSLLNFAQDIEGKNGMARTFDGSCCDRSKGLAVLGFCEELLIAI